VIKFGHFGDTRAELEYQGQEYDWVMIDEATQLTERQFRVLGACLRGTSEYKKQMYLTANPGGVGHFWFKRLFVDRNYDKGENSEDYNFVSATLDDNRWLKEGSPDYAKMLEALPEDIRRAHRYGDWNAPGGRFFSEFKPEEHVERGFSIPEDWTRYRAFDYGLDMFACIWVAVDYEGTAHVYREVQREGLVASEAAALMKRMTQPGERIVTSVAPPDMWNRQKDTGRTIAEIFASSGVSLSKAMNNRVQGWMQVKEMLRGRLKVFESCEQLVTNLAAIQVSRKNPSDCAEEPHSVTHICDALRYWCGFRFMGPRAEEEGGEGGCWLLE